MKRSSRNADIGGRLNSKWSSVSVCVFVCARVGGDTHACFLDLLIVLIAGLSGKR